MGLEDERKLESGGSASADKQPFTRGLTVGTAQATWLVPEASGASQLRDSSGVTPASLASVPPGGRPGTQYLQRAPDARKATEASGSPEASGTAPGPRAWWVRHARAVPG